MNSKTPNPAQHTRSTPDMKALRLTIGIAALILLTSCGKDSTSVANGEANMIAQAAPTTASEAAMQSSRPAFLPLNQGQWLAGDLHVHSEYSDDSTNNTISKIVAFAKENGLSFVAITDHDNHVNGKLAEKTWADPNFKSDKDFAMLYAAEWTTGRGHGTPLSATPYDHQRLYAVRDETNADVEKVVKDLKIHFSANHPTAADRWNYSFDFIDSIEVWQSSIWLPNASAVTAWHDQLSSGRMLTARGGSDSHHGKLDDPQQFQQLEPNNFQGYGNNVGTPTTWVRAKDKSGAAIVDALTYGRVSVSATPTSPRLVLLADIDGDKKPDIGMGDNHRNAKDLPVTFTVSLENLVSPTGVYNLEIIKDGGVLRTVQISAASPVYTFEETIPKGARHFFRANLIGVPSAFPGAPVAALLSATMVALSNPIYFNFRQ